VPGLWEPGTSRSLQQASLDEGQNIIPVYRLRPIGPAWSGGSISVNDIHTPHPRPETNHHENKGNPDVSSQANESNKRPPSSPIERVDHSRTAHSDGITNFNRGTKNNVQKLSHMSKQTGENPDVGPRSNPEATKPMGECLENGSQPSHQQELLRDPHSALRQLLAPGRPMTINELHRGRRYGASKRVLRSGS